MSMIELLIVIILVIILVGALPRWGYSRSWGYGPTGLVGLVVIILLIWFLFAEVF